MATYLDVNTMARQLTPRRSVAIKSMDPDGNAEVSVYRCRLQLEDLEDTAHPEVKHCGHCSRSVFRARDMDGVLQLVASDSCGWVEDDHGETVMGLFIR